MYHFHHSFREIAIVSNLLNWVELIKIYYHKVVSYMLWWWVRRKKVVSMYRYLQLE